MTIGLMEKENQTPMAQRSEDDVSGYLQEIRK